MIYCCFVYWLKAAGQLDDALKYFTKCLEGIDTSCPFVKLPECLREVMLNVLAIFLSCDSECTIYCNVLLVYHQSFLLVLIMIANIFFSLIF